MATAVKAEIVGAPGQQVMADASIEAQFGRHESLLVKQTMRGCLQECCGCEAKSEFKISAFEMSQIVDEYKVSEESYKMPDIMYALEQSSFLCRCCWRDGRPFDMKVSTGGEPGGAPIVSYKKPCGFPLYFTLPAGQNGETINCPCCCLLPKVDTMDANGNALGSESKYICDINLAVPKLQYSEQGKPVYIVKPETCCGGCCIACSCSGKSCGKGCIYIPFYFHDPESGQVINENKDQNGYNNSAPQIRKVWAGMKKECCSTADTFVVSFPPGIDANRKAGLLGMTFLIDFTVFERQQDNE